MEFRPGWLQCGGGLLICLLLTGAVLAVDGGLALVEAIARGETQSARQLLRQGADVNAAQADGATALHWAAHRDDVEIADLLIQAGADVNATNDYGVSPLSLACINASLKMGKRLIAADADPNSRRHSGETVLMTAALTGNPALVRLLLDAGSDPDGQENRRGQTALMWALDQGHREIALELIRRGADVHLRSKRGITAFLLAAQQNDLAVVKALLAAGVDVNEETPEWGSALVAAAARGHESLSIFLLRQGADPNAADSNGISSLHYAAMRGLSIMGAATSHLAFNDYMFRPTMMGLVKELLARGADPNPRVKDLSALPDVYATTPRLTLEGTTPLMLAAAAADTELLRVLLEAGADPHATSTRNVTALMLAAGLAHKRDRPTPQDYEAATEVARLLLELGVNVKTVGENGWTALHGAAFTGADGIARLLVEHGADMDLQDDFQQTPWSIAEGLIGAGIVNFELKPMGPHPSTSKLLLKLGADPMAVPGIPERYTR